ncbi:hypothetical protein RI543_001321 [Arxiozyma heterogenica]|uniref:Uncharacterized protein n=1 Tax=Arxiozyma heterogenica TaxID=278026 RepID=A0AAN7W4E0_9SACH|nr:hypothetical protein RI543_001321 [Kazachstania heterogenica]
MRVKLLNILWFLLVSVFSIASADIAQLITKDGVIYSYAVRTKTLQPATVLVSTSYYTTVQVRQITLANNEVTSTTEHITTQATIITSIPAVLANQESSNDVITTAAAQDVADPQYTSVPQISSTTTISPVSATESQVMDVKSSQYTSTLSSSQVNTLIPSQTITLTPQASSSYSRILTTITPTPQSTSVSNTQSILITSVNSEDRVCYVYYEDDEYYSTYYITGPSQTIDAASTITSTRTKTIYQTISS